MDYSIIFDDHFNTFQTFSPQDQRESAFPSIYSTIINNPYNIEHMEEKEEEEDIKTLAKQQKIMTNNSSSCHEPKPFPSISSQFISFEKLNSSLEISQQHCYGDDLDYTMAYNQGAKSSSNRGPLEAKEHVIAERNRREKINQLYIALSALLPNLKKADKASILGGATNYVKQLQERLKILEENVAKKTMESTICVKKTQIIYTDDQDSSISDNLSSHCQAKHSSLPEIEARVSERDVLIRIHCEKNKRFLLNIVLDEVQKLNLNVVSSNVMPFGRTTLYITIAAQMEEKFSSVTTKDLVKSLRLALERLA